MSLNLNEAPQPAPRSGSAGVLRGFLISSGISVAIALVSLTLLREGVGLFIIMPYGIIQTAWTIPLFFYFRRNGKTDEAKGALLSCALNVLLSVACWGAFLTNFKAG